MTRLRAVWNVDPESGAEFQTVTGQERMVRVFKSTTDRDKYVKARHVGCCEDGLGWEYFRKEVNGIAVTYTRHCRG